MNGTLLIVDDDAGTLSLLDAILSRRDVVLTATTAARAYPLFVSSTSISSQPASAETRCGA